MKKKKTPITIEALIADGWKGPDEVLGIMHKELPGRVEDPLDGEAHLKTFNENGYQVFYLGFFKGIEINLDVTCMEDLRFIEKMVYRIDEYVGVPFQSITSEEIGKEQRTVK